MMNTTGEIRTADSAPVVVSSGYVWYSPSRLVAILETLANFASTGIGRGSVGGGFRETNKSA